MAKKAEKEITFNCTYEILYSALEKIAVFFQLNGYDVDLSKTTGSFSFKRNIHLKGGTGSDDPIIKIEVFAMSSTEQKSHLKTTVSFEHNIEMQSSFTGLNTDRAILFCDKIILAVRNIVDNKESIGEDLQELKYENVKAGANNSVLILLGMLILFLIIYLLAVNK